MMTDTDLPTWGRNDRIIQPAPSAMPEWGRNDKIITPAPASGMLSNSPDDSDTSSAAKSLGTAAVKGLSNIPWTPGNLSNFADYLIGRGESAVRNAFGLEKKTPEQIMSELRDQRAKQEASSFLPTYLSRNALPTGSDIAGPVLARTGEYQPTSEPGRIAQGAAEAAIGALGPGGGVAAAPLRETASAAPAMAAGNAVAGGVGTAVTDDTGDPLLGAAAGIGAGAVGQGAKAVANKAFPSLGSGAKSRIEYAARDRLLDQSSDPAALRDWAAQPDAAPDVPGSPRTTAAAVDNDRGLFQAEKDARNVDNLPFNAGDRAQSDAQTGALRDMQPDGDVFAPGQMIRQRMDALDDAAREVEDRLTAAHQDAVAARAQGSQDFANRLQATVDADHERLVRTFAEAHDRAEAAARDGGARLGDRVNAEDLGATLRSALEDVRSEVKKVHRDLYKAVDPDGNLALVASPVRDRALEIGAQIKADGSEFDPIEAGLFRRASALPEVIQYRMLHTLDRDISAAMSKERRGAGETPAWARLTRLKGAVKSALTNAIDNQAKHEARLADAGLMDREDTMGSRLAANESGLFAGSRSAPAYIPPRTERLPAASPKPQDLISFLRQNGGIKDQGGELSARNLQQQYPGLVNKNGMNLDRAREAAAEAGYLGGDTDRAMSDTTVNHLLDAIDNHPVYSVHDTEAVLSREERAQKLEAQKRFKAARSDLTENMRAHGMDHGDLELVDDAARLMVSDGLPWDDALDRAAVALDNHRNEDLYYAAFSNRASQGETDARRAGAFSNRRGERTPAQAGETSQDVGGFGEQTAPQPNFDEAGAQRLKAANSAYADYAQTYKNPIIAPGIRTTGYSGQYRMSDAAFIKRAIIPGEKGFEVLNAHLAAVNDNPTAVAAMQQAILDPLRRTAQSSGMIHPNALARWKQSYGPALRALDRVAPGFSSHFDDAAQATQSLLDIGARHRADLAEFEKDAAARVMGLIKERKSDDAALNAQSKADTAATISRARGLSKEARQTAAGQFVKEGGDRIAPTEVENAVGNMLKTGTGGATRMRSLVESVSSNPEALAGLRKAGIDWLIRTHTNQNESIISGKKLVDFIKNNRDTIAELYSPDQLSMMFAISRDIERNAKWRTETAIKGGSDTAKNSATIFEKAIDTAKRRVSILDAATAGYLSSGAWHGAAAGAALYLVGSLRSAGLKSVDNLYREALLKPEVAKLLISKMPETKDGAALQKLVGLLRRQVIVGPGLVAEKKEKAR